MNKHSGFTVVELLITMVIVAILLTLSVVGMRGIQANARDAERKSDAETIARGLELRYKKGNPKAPQHAAGTYPGNNELWNGPLYWGQTSFNDVFGSPPDAALRSPSGERISAICLSWISNQPRCDAAEKPSTVQFYFNNGSGGYKDIYLYEFISSDSGYCDTANCRRFNLYWISETDKAARAGDMGIPGLKVVKSQHR